MSLVNTLRLAIKNVFDNFSRFIMTALAIILLSIIIITLSNVSYYYKKNLDKNLLQSINESGTEISFSVYSDKNSKKLDQLNGEDIEKFVAKATELNIISECKLQLKSNKHMGFLDNSENSIYLDPYIPGVTMYGGNPTFIKGENWDNINDDNFGIWISESESRDYGINLLDTINLTLYGNKHEFVVRGIVDTDKISYINYKYFDISEITIYGYENQYDDLSIIKSLNNLKEIGFTDGSYISGFTLTEYSQTRHMFLITLGVFAFLILLCIIFSFGCINNTLKISVESNNRSIGILKALGMKNKNLYFYVFSQVEIIIIISTLAATLLSYIIAKFSLGFILDNIFQFWDITYYVIIKNFNFLLPLLNILIMTVVVVLGAYKTLFSYFNNDSISIINGVL